MMRALMLGSLMMLAACADLRRGGRASDAAMAPGDSVADSATASTPARRTPARRPRTGSYPSAADVANGPPPGATLRDSAPAPAPQPKPSPFTGARADLQRLVAAQEQHLANVGSYATRVQYLALRYLPHPGVNVQLESASDSGWVGRATREGYPGSSCVVWVGRVPARPRTERTGLQPSVSGQAVCDPS